jgi:hypothetical protein
MMSWRWVAAAGAVALAAGFFVTWITVAPDSGAIDGLFGRFIPEPYRSQLLSPRLRYSGLELAQGPQLKTPFGTFGQLAGTTELWGAPVAGVAAVISALAIPAGRTAAGVVLAEGLAATALLFIGLQRLLSEKIPYTSISLESGLWISLVGLAVVIVGAIIGLAASRPAATLSPRSGASAAGEPATGEGPGPVTIMAVWR